MPFHAKTFQKLLIFISICTPITFLLRLWILFKTVDPQSGFFRTSSLFCTLFNIIAFAAFFFLLIVAIRLSRKGAEAAEEEVSAEGDFLYYKEEDELPEVDPADPDFLHGFAASSKTWLGTLSAFSYFLLGFGFLFSAFASVPEESAAFRYALVILQLVGGVSLLIGAVQNSSKKSVPLSFLSLAPALYFAVRMVVEYRDVAQYANKSLYIGQFLFLISALLFFLYQAEISLGWPAYAHPDLYAASALLCVFFGCNTVLPKFIAVFAAVATLSAADTAALLVNLALTLFAAAKLVAFRLEN